MEYKQMEFREILNEYMEELQCSVKQLAANSHLSGACISRYRTGERLPGAESTQLDALVTGIQVLAEQQGQRITKEDIAIFHQVNSFLRKMDEFNLVEYIRSIHFNDIKIPSIPFQLTTHKNYFGLDEMKNGELDFLKSTVLSKSREPVFMCSDMPMEDMAKDLEFSKKWMFGLAVVLKKGLHINIIHNLNRPFHEMMLGLESWIPLYMTGQISPYYFKSSQSSIYGHLHYTSGEAAMFGECILGYHNQGRYYLTRNKEEVAHYHQITGNLLRKAVPLMQIYDDKSKGQYRNFLQSDGEMKGNRHNILASLPLYTISDELLLGILKTNGVSEMDKTEIFAYVNWQRNRINRIMQSGSVQDDVPEYSKEEFARHPMILSLSGMFYERDILYSYEDYLAHLELTKEFEKSHEQYTVEVTDRHAFRNIQIIMHEGKWAMVSKNKFPMIHFVIRHPKLCNALENMMIPVSEAIPENNQ